VANCLFCLFLITVSNAHSSVTYLFLGAMYNFSYLLT